MTGPRPVGSALIGAYSLGQVQARRAKASAAKKVELPGKVTLPGTDLAAIGRRLSAKYAQSFPFAAPVQKMTQQRDLRWLLVPPIVVPCPACRKRCCYLLDPKQPLVDDVPLVGCSSCHGKFKLSDFQT